MTAALASKTVYVGGTYAWPLPASNTTITSPPLGCACIRS